MDADFAAIIAANEADEKLLEALELVAEIARDAGARGDQHVEDRARIARRAMQDLVDAFVED